MVKHMCITNAISGQGFAGALKISAHRLTIPAVARVLSDDDYDCTVGQVVNPPTDAKNQFEIRDF